MTHNEEKSVTELKNGEKENLDRGVPWKFPLV